MLETPIQELADRQVWLRAFYGFDPEGSGFIGFTNKSDQEKMLTRMRDGDLVLIYGAVENLTNIDLRRQALGFLEVALEECVDRDRMSPEAWAWRTQHGFEHRWNHGIVARRAWRVLNRVHVKSIAPTSYQSRYRFERTTKAKLLEPDERRLALSHAVKQVNVFGEPPIRDLDLSTGPLGQVLKPSKGIPPSYGTKTTTTEDGDNYLYLMVFSGGSEVLLGKQGNHVGRALVKVGRSNDPKRRLADVNSGFPESAVHKWELKRFQVFPSGNIAHNLEDAVKEDFDTEFTSQGGEFFTGDYQMMEERFQKVCISSMPKILGAPGKAQGVK